jgi:hypothetical protein
MNPAIDPARAAAALMDALSSTFADIAFIDVEPVAGEATDEPIAAPVRAAIDVLKPISCRLELECSPKLKDRIEATIFEGGENGGEEDSLLELLNVIAGAFLTSYFGTGADVKLEFPQYLFLPDGRADEILAQVRGDAEGEPIRAALSSVRYRY